jgi:hypothetical protein
MEKPRLITHKIAAGLGAIYLALTAGTAWADWRFEGGEGTYYAFITDGGFVEGSYKNSLMFFCPDDGRICELYVTIDGETPQRNVVVTLAFQDGQTFQRLAEEVNGGRPQIDWEGEILRSLIAQDSVTVSIGDGPGHRFSLAGSTAAIQRAMRR